MSNTDSLGKQLEIDMTGAPHSEQSGSPSLNPPDRDRFYRIPEDYNAICVPMYNASVTGNLEAAKVIIDKHRELVRCNITKRCETPLHIAILGKSSELVQYLIGVMTNEDLQLLNGYGETALHVLARARNSIKADLLVSRNRGLSEIPNEKGEMPLYVAASFRKLEMVNYLYDKSGKMEGWTDTTRSKVLEKCVETSLFDISLKILSDHPELAASRTVLCLLARQPDAFLATRPPIIQRIIKSVSAGCLLKAEFHHKESEAFQLLRVILKEMMMLPMTKVDDILGIKTGWDIEGMEVDKDSALFLAAEMGNTNFIREITRQYPHLTEDQNASGRSIFHVAIIYRNEGVFRLLYENDHIRDLMVTLEDYRGNNMLHLVGMIGVGNRVANVQGMSLRLNPDLLWYKEVESILPGHLHEKRNDNGKTPSEVFIKERRQLFGQEERSIKDISAQLMVVAALVATISFAAIFTFPGGYNQETGIPIFLHKNLAKIFTTFNSLSFISSANAILMIISILNSNYDGIDAMLSAPKQLRKCLALIFFSVATITLTFLINLFILYHNSSNWIPILVSVFAIIPYLVFANRQYNLLSFRKKLW